MEVKAFGIHGFFSEKTQTIDVSEMGVRQQYRGKERVLPD
jgi:hypothetical protein